MLALVMQRENTTFDGLAAYRIAAMGLQREAGAERAWGYLVSSDYFTCWACYLSAAWAPARRAVSVDPARTLRES